MGEYTHVENEFGVVESEKITISAATEDGSMFKCVHFWHAIKKKPC